MRIAILTNEYPPNVYGGAGVHVEYLTRELAALDDGAHHIDVLCFGEQDGTYGPNGNLRVRGVTPIGEVPVQDERHVKFLDTMQRDLVMAGSVVPGTDIVHGHTWYSHFAGCLAKQLAGARLVLSTHSLEPHRPWKVEQLGTAYHGSSWVERTAYENADGVVAVSHAMNHDVQTLYGVDPARVRTIYNGIDLQQYRPRPRPEVLRAHGVDPEAPIVLFVGRITRQKGILHLVNALRHLTPETDEGPVQVALLAGAPDTEAIEQEMTDLVEQARADAGVEITWIPEMLPKDDVIAFYTGATVFVCPSVYEPFGIINLEAMACQTPVVASAVGGIPEIVVPGETGLLVEFDPQSVEEPDPTDPEAFSKALAENVNALLTNPDRRAAMAAASRTRVEDVFSWQSIARQTLDFYQDLAEE
jgi:glycogen synthase